ncbi:IclR family transcriptional regulator [Paraburkholderia oxyphila]|uniref:IclR family transcriptional regulator n=1 Tax=Paraburkholderia oxyphila TaxID=614212 RepID=UPI0005BBF27E|nr:IclR family transcriptional regulator [Paraburkholderia oxyphila]
MSSDGVAAVERALDILEAFNERDGALALAEIASRTGFYKSTILRLIESLEKYGYVQRTTDGLYRLGPKTLSLGFMYQRNFTPADFVPQALRRLVDEINESASFYVRDGDSRVCLFRQDADRAIRDSVHVGHWLPLNVGAGGHVLLAFSGLTGDKYERIRGRMYATSVGERDPETAAIACPVLGVRDQLVGVLTISGPRYRLEVATLESFVPTLLKFASELSKQCGGDETRFLKATRRK